MSKELFKGLKLRRDTETDDVISRWPRESSLKPVRSPAFASSIQDLRATTFNYPPTFCNPAFMLNYCRIVEFAPHTLIYVKVEIFFTGAGFER